MSLFTILNASIEIGESLIEFKKLEFPNTYRQIFKILGKNKILSLDLTKKLSSFMRQRNMIAHQYDDININDIYELYLKRDIFSKFVDETKKLF